MSLCDELIVKISILETDNVKVVMLSMLITFIIHQGGIVISTEGYGLLEYSIPPSSCYLLQDQ